MLYIGSHVSMSGKEMLLGSVKEAVSNGANALMIYTGAPQNTKRKPIEELMIKEGVQLLKDNDILIENVIIHAPYIINLGNTIKPETYEIAIKCLKEEIQRTEAIGAKYIVLHPGAHVKEGADIGLKSIVKGLNEVLTKEQKAIICLETMAGKGTECGRTFEELAYIINNVDLPEKLGVCMDTCHIHDAGYDLNDFDAVLDEFEKNISIDKLKVLHINDSKNPIGAHKDRHDNFGYGFIGYDNLINIIYNKRVENIAKILETPYVNDRSIPPYKEEIKMIKNNNFVDWLDENRIIKK
ncbi:MAG: deoxyribonuclease IV [Mycoplasmatales bacterium]